MTPGEILRAKREEKNLTLEQVAAGTNIRIQFLQAIEEERQGAIASPAQYRGFLRLYASFLGLNPLLLFEPEVQPSAQTEQKEPVEQSSQNPELKPAPKIIGKKQLLKSSPVSEKETPVSDLIFQEIGDELRRQRESLGLSLADVERQIKIKELYLYALENGQIKGLPSTVQGRGMLNNYAAFMNLNPESLQMRFAEGLQQRRTELAAEDLARKNSNEVHKFSSPITGWRRYFTPDLIVSAGVFLVLFTLVVWGSWQVIKSSQKEIEPTAQSISEILAATQNQSNQSAGQIETPFVTDTAQVISTLPEEYFASTTQVNTDPINLVVVAYQRAYMKVTADGKDVFVGRVVPGNVYTYSGSTKITLTTGNAAAVQVYYNQEDLGILGVTGQVITMEFTGQGMTTPTPKFTPSPTATSPATLTPQPTQYIPPTPTVRTPSPTVEK